MEDRTMDSSKIDRRKFLAGSARAGMAICGACLCSGIPAFAAEQASSEGQESLDPKQLNFCGYRCPPDCQFLKATLENNIELKKEAWKLWKIEERFGVEFDPEQAICYGCKEMEKPAGIVLKRCTVRSCAMEKKLDCCIECEELQNCDKELWTRFPKFKEQVIEMRERYIAQG
jgi:hypothetical protein